MSNYINMNWYKKAQQLEVVDVPSGSGQYYTDYGHDLFNIRDIKEYKKYKSSDPNYMWVFTNGRVDVEEETGDNLSHGYIDKWNVIDWGKVYSGRYSGKEKKITVLPPFKGLARLRGLPSSIQTALRRAFPEAEQIYMY